jgi:hypothetical protein
MSPYTKEKGEQGEKQVTTGGEEMGMQHTKNGSPLEVN